IAMHPDFFTRKRRLHHAAAIDVAVIQELCLSLAPQFQPVSASTKTLAKCANEPAFLIKDYNRFTTHAALVHRMADVDIPMLILAKPVRIAPHQSLRRNQPVMDALVRVGSGTHDWKPSARLI